VVQLSQPLAVVTPTLDAPVLAALALADESFTTGQLMRLLGHGSEEGIRRVLRRLRDQGVVTAERVGVAYSYRLNRQHLAARHIIALANIKSELLLRIEKELTHWAQPPVYAAVFGSAARGSMRADSDIDILLVQGDGQHEQPWEDQVENLVRSVTKWTGNDTRPLEYTVQELHSSRTEPVLSDVLRTGLTVAGQRSWLSSQLRSKRS